MKGGKRSGAILIRRYPRSGGGRSWDLGPTLPAPFLYATWFGEYARWNGFLTYWR
jgi:hypothetical protein